MVFDIDNWAEIFSTIKKNKMRTFLTGFAISWGIFMFCILLASGNGLRNGMVTSFGDRSVNSLQYWSRRTSIPYMGFPERRPLELTEKDLDLLKNQVPEAADISAMIYTDVNTSYSTYTLECSFVGVNSNYQKISGAKIKDGQGRFLNEMDVSENRKVAVINQRMKEALFNNEDAVGKLFLASNIGYQVIGVYEENTWGDQAQAYIPISTAQLLYHKGHGYDNISFTLQGLNTKDENEVFEKRFREQLSQLHIYAPTDNRAIGIWNSLEDFLQFLGILNGISAFIWIIGVGTLIAGMIGVSNIMLITVRERTREIGIRKALGAKPNSILGSILMESVFITSVFGYIGMFLGVGLGELVNMILESADVGQMSSMFKNPTIEVNVAVGAMVVLIISGLLAGYFPALRAVNVSAVEAMRAGE